MIDQEGSGMSETREQVAELSDEELAALRHSPQTDRPWPRCRHCGDLWACMPARLVATIDARDAALAEAREERDRANAALAVADQRVTNAVNAFVDAAEARDVERREVAELREALEAIAAPDDLLDANDAFAPNAARRMQEQARFALASTGSEGDSNG